MTVIRYEPKYFPQIKEWGRQWGANYNEDQFPKVGFMVDGVAAYFLYQTDSVCCWLENMVSNKNVEGQIKDRALELIVDEILAEAKALGFKLAYASTNRVRVAVRAKERGAIILPNHLFLTLKLT